MSVEIYISYIIFAREETWFFFLKKDYVVCAYINPFVRSGFLLYIIIIHPFDYEILFSRTSQKGIHVYNIIRLAEGECRFWMSSNTIFTFFLPISTILYIYRQPAIPFLGTQNACTDVRLGLFVARRFRAFASRLPCS